MFVCKELAGKLLPIPEDGRREPTRRQAKKVPSWHLTGKKTIQYVKEADSRSKEKKAKVEKENIIKKEAVDKHRAAERKASKKRK